MMWGDNLLYHFFLFVLFTSMIPFIEKQLSERRGGLIERETRSFLLRETLDDANITFRASVPVKFTCDGCLLPVSPIPRLGGSIDSKEARINLKTRVLNSFTEQRVVTTGKRQLSSKTKSPRPRSIVVSTFVQGFSLSYTPTR